MPPTIPDTMHGPPMAFTKSLVIYGDADPTICWLAWDGAPTALVQFQTENDTSAACLETAPVRIPRSAPGLVRRVRVGWPWSEWIVIPALALRTPSQLARLSCEHTVLVTAYLFRAVRGEDAKYGRCTKCQRWVTVDAVTGAEIPAIPANPPPIPTTWIVTNDQAGLSATVRHKTEQAARVEAKRLVQTQDGAYAVWQLVGRYSRDTAPVVWHEAGTEADPALDMNHDDPL